MNIMGDDLHLVLAALKDATLTASSYAVPHAREWMIARINDLVERIEQWQKDEAEEEAEPEAAPTGDSYEAALARLKAAQRREAER